MEAEIQDLIDRASRIKSSGDYSAFEKFRTTLTEWSRKQLIVGDNQVKDILIQILELKLDYPKWYRFLVLPKFKPQVLSKSHQEGKYLLYLDESIDLLGSLLFRKRF